MSKSDRQNVIGCKRACLLAAALLAATSACSSACTNAVVAEIPSPGRQLDRHHRRRHLRCRGFLDRRYLRTSARSSRRRRPRRRRAWGRHRWRRERTTAPGLDGSGRAARHRTEPVFPQRAHAPRRHCSHRHPLRPGRSRRPCSVAARSPSADGWTGRALEAPLPAELCRAADIVKECLTGAELMGLRCPVSLRAARRFVASLRRRQRSRRERGLSLGGLET